MAWGGFILTNAGRNLLAKVQAGTIAELNITRFGIGDGNYSGSFSTIANLVSQRQPVPLRAKKAKDQYVNIEGYFSNEGLAEGFYFREWGIFAMNGAQEILYAYDNAGADAEYIAPDGSIRYEKLLKAALAITADVNVTINTSGSVYVTAEELEERFLNISSKAADISIEDTAGHFTSENVEGALAELFQSVSNGKSLVAGAITDKGVITSPTDTFQQMANNIDAIVTDPSIGTTDALAADVLSPKKVVSQGQLLIGTMPNRGPAVAETVNITDHNQEYTIAQGYHSGLRKIKAVITNLAAGVIKAGVTVGGILGTFTSDATATAAQMLAGAKAYVNGVLITGTIPSKGAQIYTPGTTNQVISANQYLSGAQTIAGSANFIESNIKDGVNMWGKVGTYKNVPTAVASTINFKEFNDIYGSLIYNISTYISAYVKAVEIEFILPVSGTLNVKYTHQVGRTGTAVYNYYIRLYKNDVAVGTEHYVRNTAGDYNYSDSVSVLPGDKLALYIKQDRDESASNPPNSYIKNINLGMTLNGCSELFKLTSSYPEAV